MDQSSIFKKTSAPPGLLYVNANDLKRPEIGPPIYHSTAKLPVSNEKQNKFKFPTPNTTKERPKDFSLGLLPEEVYDTTLSSSFSLLSSRFKKLNKASRNSSMGILNLDSLEELSAENEKSICDWLFNKPDPAMTNPVSEVVDGLENKYFSAAATKNLQNETSEVGLDDILGSTMGDVTQDRLDNFDWSRVDDELEKTKDGVSKSPPKIEIEAPTMDSIVTENSFFGGAMSARSTSFGSRTLGSTGTCQTLNEGKFEDFSTDFENFASSFPSVGSSDGYQVEDGDFGPVTQDNLALMDAEENVFQTGNATLESKKLSEDTFFTAEDGDISTASTTQYFSENTSRLGSLESSTYLPIEENRPNLGFGQINSPKRQPVKMLQDVINETFTKEEQKNLDLKTILESLPNGKNKDLLLDVVKQVADKQKTIRNETISYDEAAPSFLEETLVETHTTAHQTQTLAEIQKLNIPTTLPPTEASTCFKVPSAPVRAAKSVSKSKIPTLNKNGFQSKLPIMTSAGKENNFLNVKESKNSNTHHGSASAPPKKNKVLNDSTNKRKLRTSSPLKVPAKDFSKVHPIDTSTDVDKNFVQVDHSKAEVVLHQLTGSDLNDDDSKVDVGPTEVSQNKLKETQIPKRKNNIEIKINKIEHHPEPLGPELLYRGPRTSDSDPQAPTMQQHLASLDSSTSYKPGDYPIQSNRKAISWNVVPLNESRKQIITLRNISDKNVAVNVCIVDSKEFHFEDGKQNSELNIQPSQRYDVSVYFAPKSASEEIKTGVLKIRVHGYKNQNGKSVKNSVKLEGRVNVEESFLEMSVEETLSETVLSQI